MKKLLPLLLIAFIASCEQPVKNSYTIKGSVDTVFDGWVYLQERLDGSLTSIDSSQLVNGQFTFSGTALFPELHYINIKETKSLIPFFLEPSEIIIDINTSNIDQTNIAGSSSQNEYDTYLDMLDRFNNKLRENYGLYSKALELGDEEKAARFDSIIIEIDRQRSVFIKDYILTNNTSAITPYLLYRNLYNYNLEELGEAMSNLDTASLSASPYMPYLDDYLATLVRTDIGMPFVPFKMKDTSGDKVITLKSLTGENYLLVDFWASWCSPCREENPNLLAMYNKYKDKGFDILGVSLDRNRDNWIKAIEADGLDWHHVSDLQYWQNSAAKLYGVKSIPANVLIGPDGIIIAKNLRGEELGEKLEEIFNKPDA